MGMSHIFTEESYWFCTGLNLGEYRCNPSLTLSLIMWMGPIHTPSILLKTKTEQLIAKHKERPKGKNPILSLWEVGNNLTANIL